MHTVIRAFSLLAIIAIPAAAQDAQPAQTYTPEELAALDRALDAANLTRHDLTFRKDVTEGHGAMPIVRRMLRDPLLIAREMDALVEQQAQLAQSASPGAAALTQAYALPWVAPFAISEDSEWWHSARNGQPDGLRTDSAQALLESLVRMAAAQPSFTGIRSESEEPGDPEFLLDVLRAELPAEMAWHDVFEAPFEGERQAAIDAWAEAAVPSALHEVAKRVDTRRLARHWFRTFQDPPRWLSELPAEVFPQTAPEVIETPNGRVALGTPGDDVWTGDYAILIDPGGDDRYVSCRIGASWGTSGRRLGFFADLGGDDVYECAEVNITLGAAVLGIAGFFDLGAGDDRYQGGHASLGAAMGGVALFYDDGGSDIYEGRTFTQGAAGFGAAVFFDDAVQEPPVVTADEGTPDPVDIGLFDNDRLHAWANAQAFARPRGVALCVNRRGNDIYEAGGVYLHAPLFADRYQSYSQGFAIGSRDIDWAGGVAMLIDHDGNDRYLGDIYNQGVGYWYGAGLLWDGGGNDTYEMTQYGQGSGIHLAVGGLVDVAGNDTYVMHSGLGQGGSHDYAASVLHDRGGNDRYHGSTSCNGSGLTNSVGLHIDRAGDDVYGARSRNGVNFGRPARDFPSIGILLDLQGTDDYLGVMEDGGVWRHTDIGVGVDVVAPSDAAVPGAPPVDPRAGKAVIPEIVGYAGELTQEVFDELWEIAVRWEVGDNRTIVPEARKRLIAFGAPVIPLMDGKVETDNSGLELRAFVGVLRGLGDGGAVEQVREFLRGNAAAESERRRRVALYLIGELKAVELDDAVLAILQGDEPKLARRAASVLAKLGSHAGDETLRGWLQPDTEELRLQAAIGALLSLEADCYGEARQLLDHPTFSVRMRLVTLLARHLPRYRDAISWDLAKVGFPARSQRSLLDVLARSKTAPAPPLVLNSVHGMLSDADPGVRADAARVVRHWESLEEADRAELASLLEQVERMATDDEDEFVRFAARPR